MSEEIRTKIEIFKTKNKKDLIIFEEAAKGTYKGLMSIINTLKIFPGIETRIETIEALMDFISIPDKI